ncbi:hypothetical protein FA13DRAFT_1794787 [Coprinellus micaceus]|uniref:BTB domain-containing protein n=1 Tax=Coprinellus micaceus TaxID=71717 RepID=A0A4Y7T180_COPMI|nr:hypothetical protein FA13DRAFT_1794787 [Coprinellus micaceus]
MPKRQRTDSEPPTEGPHAQVETVAEAEGGPTAGTVAPPTQSKEVWFEDGNIIIQAQNVQFKVYKAILSQRSQFFADALGPIRNAAPYVYLIWDLMVFGGIPQPANSEATSGGCPVVELRDSPDDLKHVLLALHGEPAYTNVRVPLPFPVIAALVRLGKKTTSSIFGTKAFVGQYAKHIYCPDKTAEDDMIVSAIQLAHECDIQTILPALYYTLVQDTDNPFRGAAHLPPYIVYTCLSGRDKIIRSWHSELYRRLGELGEIHNCIGKPKCKTVGLQIFKKVFSTPLNSVLTTWEGLLQQIPMIGTNWNLAQDLCQVCRERAKANHWASRKGIWDSMPGYFGLPPRLELKDLAI